MKASANNLVRLQFLSHVVQKEIQYLQQTDQRLFTEPFTTHKAESLDSNIDLSERVDAFVCRFGRLQDNLGDKLLPHYLNMLGEKTGAVLDNLNLAEKLGLIQSADIWMTLRELRNQMIHEYMEDPVKLTDALNKGHEHVQTLCKIANKIVSDIADRGWNGAEGISNE